jgi:simple sugar transport system substrate-binding protein
MPAENQALLDEFIASLASEDANVWTGPIFLQDGSEYVPAGSIASDEQVWYLPQLILGMTGPSE